MVRILSCHHFQAQRTGRTEEPVGVAIVDDGVIIVGLEHRINVYYLSDIESDPRAGGYGEFNLDEWLNRRRKTEFGNGHLGDLFTFSPNADASPSSPNPQSIINTATNFGLGQSGELKLSHYFAPVAVLNFLQYNARGQYIVTLETQETLSSIRVYFKWEKDFKSKPMTARIAGLVSPTLNRDAEENSLLMIEIPPSPSFSPKSVATCQLTGNIASLSTDLRVCIYNYQVKQGRLKTQYGDFDLICIVQLFGISPDRISFLSDYVACMEFTKAYVLRITKLKSSLPKTNSIRSPGNDSLESSSGGSGNVIKLNGISTPNEEKDCAVGNDKVVFNRKNNSIKVFLNTITRSNRKQKQPNSFLSEEFQDDIKVNKSEVLFSSTNAEGGFSVEDLLRIHISKNNDFGDNLLKMELSPVRIGDKLGGISFVAATCKEAFSYHLPTRRDSYAARQAVYTFTSTMITCSSDSLFFHVLTTSGLETFTSRYLYNALKDTDGFDTYVNDCPLVDESPVLIGLRPFMGARMMCCNEYSVCVLTTPSSGTAFQVTTSKTSTPEVQRKSTEETLWTMYALRNPTWDVLYKDIMKEALVHQTSNPDAYSVLVAELHLLLRALILRHADSGNAITDHFKRVTRLIGFEYFRKSTRESLDENKLDHAIDKGITYLILANCDIPYLFSSPNSDLVKDPQLASGIVKFIQTTLPRTVDDSNSYSPTLSRQILEFLAVASTKTMISLAINVPWFRECNSKRLSEILNGMLATDHFTEDDCLALVLTLVTMHGSYRKGRSSVKEVLDKMAEKHLTLKIPWNLLVDHKKAQAYLTDLLVCLSSAHSTIHIQILTEAIRNEEVPISDILVAFSHGVSLNAEMEVQKTVGKDLMTLLENYFVDQQSEKRKSAKSPTSNREDEMRALHALVRAYLTHISVNTHIVQSPESPSAHPGVGREISLVQTNSSQIGISSGSSLALRPGAPKMDAKWLRFGKIPEFINQIIPELQPRYQPRAEDVESVFPSLESKEFFIKLSSLLGSDYGHTPGLEELIGNILVQRGSLNSPVHVCIKLLSQSPEAAINTLMTNHPMILMVYAKEIFGKSPKKWKTLITKLKEKIKADEVNVDIFTTIIESAYLHLANTLSPAELEHVLEKKDENAKFHAACRRIDLANSFTSKVVAMAEDYLTDTK